MVNIISVALKIKFLRNNLISPLKKPGSSPPESRFFFYGFVEFSHIT